MALLIIISKLCLYATIFFLTLYAIRHYILAYSRFSLARPRDTMDIVGFVMPKITILVPMHNEEKVAADILQALIACDYDWEKLQVIAINDRSEDRTGAIIDEFSEAYPMIRAFHRTEGPGGKPAALLAASEMATGDIILLFDADYYPGRAMLKMLVAPFADPKVGAVMGRVVPHNAGGSLLAGLLSLERAAGYQDGQQARYNLGLTAQFGGTVGGVRRTALMAVGGWNTESLTEDTDLTCRLLERGWEVAYVNRAECYEEVPVEWKVRRNQLQRWVIGHNGCFHRYAGRICRSEFLSRWQKVDAVFMLGCYWTAPVLVLGWLASLVLYFAHHPDYWGFVALLMFLGYQLFANQATFVELGTAAMLDGSSRRILLLPLNLLNFFSSTVAICNALWQYYLNRITGDDKQEWQKTGRTRDEGDAGQSPFLGGGQGGDRS